MKSTLCIAMMAACAMLAGPALAAGHSGSTCEAKAVDKDGRPLSGTAKNAFMKKCESDIKTGMPQSGGMAHTGALPVPGGTATSGSVAPVGGVANAAGMAPAGAKAAAGATVNPGGMAHSGPLPVPGGTATSGSVTPAGGVANAAGMPSAKPGMACSDHAMDKNGKALSGAAKTSHMKKCESQKGDALSCAGSAVDKNSRALVGAAKDSFMKKCESDAMSGKK